MGCCNWFLRTSISNEVFAHHSQMGSDGIAPHAEAREDMRRHMQGMRSGRSDFGVCARCKKTLLGHFLVVAGVDQIMCDSGCCGCS